MHTQSEATLADVATIPSDSGAPRAVCGGRTVEAVGITALVNGARSGDQIAWNALVDRYTPLLWWIARRHRLNETDAADAVQITWLRCVQNLDRLRDANSLAGWLASTCRHESVDTLRRNARCTPQDPNEPAGPLAQLPAQDVGADPAEAAICSERVAVLREAIGDLPERQRRVLTALMDLGPEEGHVKAAAALDMPIGSLGPTRQRALRRLRHDQRLLDLGLSRPG